MLWKTIAIYQQKPEEGNTIFISMKIAIVSWDDNFSANWINGDCAGTLSAMMAEWCCWIVFSFQRITFYVRSLSTLDRCFCFPSLSDSPSSSFHFDYPISSSLKDNKTLNEETFFTELWETRRDPRTSTLKDVFGEICCIPRWFGFCNLFAIYTDEWLALYHFHGTTRRIIRTSQRGNTPLTDCGHILLLLLVSPLSNKITQCLKHYSSVLYVSVSWQRPTKWYIRWCVNLFWNGKAL